MRLLFLGNEYAKKMKDRLDAKGLNMQIQMAKSICDIKIKEDIYDIVLTFNLHQFDQVTLTDNISYNILPYKQIHIITVDNLPNEKYLKKQLSIAMFFYCTDLKYCRYLEEEYPNIPFLNDIYGWKDSNDEKSVETNANILLDIIMEVEQMCHLNN